MITPSFSLTATERVLPKLALDFTTASLDSRITFTRTTGASNPATYFNGSGVLTSATNNEPRFDYNPVTLACKGLLIEEARTNLLIYVQEFENAQWSKSNVTVTQDATTAPDGTLTADKLLETATTAVHRIVQAPTTSTATYAFSAYAKAAERTFVQLRDVTGAVGVWFNLATGAVGTQNSGITGSIEPAGNGWYRCTAVRTTGATNVGWGIAVADANGSSIYAGDVTKGVFIWGAQVEAGAFATSYIPTTTTALTRNADVATMTGANFSDWWQAGKGGAMVQAIPSTVSGIRPLVQYDDGTANEIIALRGNTANPELYIVDGGTPQAQLDAGTIAANTSYRLAGAWGTDSCAASINSGTPALDGAATIPTVNQARLGSDGTNYLNGWLESIEYYDTPPTSADLQVLSSTAGYRSMIRSMINPVL
jgi:hypothetical protein